MDVRCRKWPWETSISINIQTDKAYALDLNTLPLLLIGQVGLIDFLCKMPIILLSVCTGFEEKNRIDSIDGSQVTEVDQLIVILTCVCIQGFFFPTSSVTRDT